MAKRHNYSAAFKAKVALETLREELTLPECAKKYDVHPNQISTWKKEKQKDNFDAEIKGLHVKIGQLSVENDFLSQAFNPASITRLFSVLRLR